MPRRPGGFAAILAGLGLALLASLPAAQAHGLIVQFRGSGQVSLTIRDTQDAPVAGAAAQVFAPGSAVPVWSGTTDGEGGLTFPAATDGVWHIDLLTGGGHSDRLTLRIVGGLPVDGAQLPAWLLAASLTGNVLTFFLVVLPRLRARRGRAAVPGTRAGG